MDVAIVGGGAAGMMAAWQIAQSGRQVTVFEQFTLDHDRGSSYGESRIVRRVYPDRLYTGLMAEAYDLWDELQEIWRSGRPPGAESGDAELIRRGGGLFFGQAGDPNVEAAEAALRASKVPYEKLTAREVHHRFPAFHLPEDTDAIFEPSMGYARASRAVFAAAFLAKQCGAEVIENTQISRIGMSGGRLAISTISGAEYFPEKLLITSGAWTAQFLHQAGITVPLKVTRQAYIHLEAGSRAEQFGKDQFPTWIDASTNMYGFPEINPEGGIKLASHNRGATCTGDSVDRLLTDADTEQLIDYARSRFPELGGVVTYSKVCLYTNTPDEDFIVDAVPGLPGAYVISACSGHGFKFAPLIGRIAAELVRDGASRRDLSRFGLARFRQGL